MAIAIAVTAEMTTGSAPPSAKPIRHGVRCSGYVGAEHKDLTPIPTSYQVSDAGRPGVPFLTPAEQGLLNTIKYYEHSKTLRFVFLSNKRDHHRMIVYDASQGPCIDNAPGYHVLNGACNEYYEPGENPRYTIGIPSCDILPPPWPITKF